ncbi:MAG TPA: putative metal-dependent hydrolase [Bryobacteraceae bacterium]|nr:putative metal-dependent hydrolase [Bryobacteraceae bacterium]
MDLRFPIGKFDFSAPVAAEDRPRLIDQIEATPAGLRAAVSGLTAEQLDTPYRPGGWSVRQTVHHVADSHINSFVRLRLALTENEPTIKPYDEAKWAELVDVQMPVEVSLGLLEYLHQRWVVLLRSLADAEFARTFRHPEVGVVRLDTNLALYAWHGRHHTAHITALRQRNGWE